jgi:hypothetical protein
MELQDLASPPTQLNHLFCDRVLEVVFANGGVVPLYIREPRWADGVEVSLNGMRLATLNRDGYQRLSQNWKKGDTVLLKYLMRARAVKDKAGRIAIFHGPWLLGVDEESNPFFFDEPHQLNALQISVGKNGSLDLEPAAGSAGSPFAVPAARYQVTYLPGGYQMLPSVATLRPVAEQTGFRSTAWEYWFRISK